MKKYLMLIFLVPLILAACGGGPDCAEPVEATDLQLAYDLTAEARFESGLSYLYPQGWRLTRVSGSQHELYLPEFPQLVIRVVDTAELTGLGLPATLSTNESDLDLYAEAFYPDASKTGFDSGTIAGTDFAGASYFLECQGHAHITAFNNLNGTVAVVDIRSEAGPIPSQFSDVGFNVRQIIAGNAN